MPVGLTTGQPWGYPYGNPFAMTKITPLLLPPLNVTATVTGSDIVLTWDAASSVDGYNVYQSIDSGAWTKLNATIVEALTYTLTPIDPGIHYFYATSVRGSKESSASETATTSEAMMVQVYTGTLTPQINAIDGNALVDDVAAVTTYADGNHLIEIIDSSGNVISAVLVTQGTGEVLGTAIASGTLTEDVLYKIVSTTLDYFGTGLAVGDYFTSDGTEVCDASNTVSVVIGASVNGVILEDRI